VCERGWAGRGVGGASGEEPIVGAHSTAEGGGVVSARDPPPRLPSPRSPMQNGVELGHKLVADLGGGWGWSVGERKLSHLSFPFFFFFFFFY